MTSSRSDYCYEPLKLGKDEIRLLTLLPDLDEDGLICCQNATFDLATAPEFQALSYEWGSTEQPQNIRVDEGLLNIRQNLWLFLDMFRAEERNHILLWVDQICIDQQNDSERGHQVKLMGNIYSRAVRTIAWLGPSTGVDTGLGTAVSRHGHLIDAWRTGDMTDEEHSAEMKAAIQRISSEPLCIYGECSICNSTLKDRDQDLSSSQQEGVAEGLIVPAEDPRVSEWWIRDLQDPCDLSYWTRLWIVQENVLARDCDFFLGIHRWSRLDLSRYVELENYYSALRSRHKSSLGRYVKALTNLVEPINDSPLEWVIIEFWRDHLTCSDPHDLVYGLLGLVKPAQRIPIDYQSTFPDVYEQLMDAVILSPTLYRTLLKHKVSEFGKILERICYRLGSSSTLR